MTNSRKLLLIVVLACLGLIGFAKDNEVYLLVKVTLTQKIDPFYARTFNGDPQNESLVYPNQSPLNFVRTPVVKKQTHRDGDFFFIYCTYAKGDNYLDFDSFNYVPYKVHEAYVTLPFAQRITIPDGARYVYIGSLEYDVDPKTIRVKSITIRDEYEAAQAAANKIMGGEVQLVRAPINDIPIKESSVQD